MIEAASFCACKPTATAIFVSERLRLFGRQMENAAIVGSTRGSKTARTGPSSIRPIENSKTLSGVADMDIYSTTEMPGQEGKRFEGLTLRLFNPKTRLQSFGPGASNTGVLDPPVVGLITKTTSGISSARIRSKANLLS